MANGWGTEKIDDGNEFKEITNFEQKLPFKKISLLEFERRIKKLVQPGSEDMITHTQFKACFGDHYAFKDL